MIGIFKKEGDFKLIHSDLPAMLSRKSKEFQLDKFIHLSALGIEKVHDSKYALSKLEKRIRKFKKSIIFKPSIVYSVDDKFTTKYVIVKHSTVYAIIFDGKTKFSPIHVLDLVDIIYNILDSKQDNLILGGIGPEVLH